MLKYSEIFGFESPKKIGRSVRKKGDFSTVLTGNLGYDIGLDCYGCHFDLFHTSCHDWIKQPVDERS